MAISKESATKWLIVALLLGLSAAFTAIGLFHSSARKYAIQLDDEAPPKLEVLKKFRVDATILPGSIDTKTNSFTLFGSKFMLRFQSAQALPKDLGDCAPVIVEGKLENNVFIATQIMTKCSQKPESPQGECELPRGLELITP